MEKLWSNLRHYPAILWRDGTSVESAPLENQKGYERIYVTVKK